MPASSAQLRSARTGQRAGLAPMEDHHLGLGFLLVGLGAGDGDHQALGVVVHVFEVKRHQLNALSRPGQAGFGGTAWGGPRLGLRAGLRAQRIWQCSRVALPTSAGKHPGQRPSGSHAARSSQLRPGTRRVTSDLLSALSVLREQGIRLTFVFWPAYAATRL